MFWAPKNYFDKHETNCTIFQVPREEPTEKKGSIWSSSSSKNQKSSAVPCLFLRGSMTHLIYFHGNNEDIGYCNDFLINMQSTLKWTIWAVEYPGYSIYKGGSATCRSVLEDAECVFLFLTKNCGIAPKNIIVCGRSLGSGPACYLFSKFEFGGLALISPFINIRDIFENLPHPIRGLIPKWFDNEGSIKTGNSTQTNASFITIHGSTDKLIPSSHSEKLYELFESTKKDIKIIPNYGHNDLPTSAVLGALLSWAGKYLPSNEETFIPHFWHHFPIKKMAFDNNLALFRLENESSNSGQMIYVLLDKEGNITWEFDSSKLLQYSSLPDMDISNHNLGDLLTFIKSKSKEKNVFELVINHFMDTPLNIKS